MKILILGGYGAFGGRLANLLKDLDRLTIFIGGRSQAKAKEFCRIFNGKARVEPVAIDRNNSEPVLEHLKPDMLIDASGPFQVYGAQPYRVIEACISQSVNYVDLADGREFVSEISELDSRAREAGVFVLSGLSTCPALTHAVIDHLADGLEIDEVVGGIAPSPHVGIGASVMQAIVGYAGDTINSGSKIAPTGIAFADTKPHSIAPPGNIPIRRLPFSLVDVPEFDVLHQKFPSLKSVWFGAATRPVFLHKTLVVLANIRAALHLPSMRPLASLFHQVHLLMRFGEHRGGMFVEVQGKKQGKPVKRTWHLVAEGDDGPLIPCLAAEIVVRKLYDGGTPDTGARPALDVLTLDDFEAQFLKHRIVTGIRSDEMNYNGLYEKALEGVYKQLPNKLQELHRGMSCGQWRGKANVTRGEGVLSNLVARIIGFPKTARNIDVTVSFDRDERGELWTRNFAGQNFSSYQALGTGKNTGLVTEKFGISTFGLALVVNNQKLQLVPCRWTILGIPMPRFLLPGSNTFEYEEDDKFWFDVTIELPFIGKVVTYKGWLLPD